MPFERAGTKIDFFSNLFSPRDLIPSSQTELCANLAKMNPRPILHSLALLAGTIAAGLAIRFLPLDLPQLIVKYGGSMLWAATIYWLISTLLSRTRLPALLLLSGSIATAVELFKLFRSPDVDAFRSTLPGVLLLGSHFSPWDIAAYWIAIAAAAVCDPRKSCQ
jgi:hypothetical protein